MSQVQASNANADFVQDGVVYTFFSNMEEKKITLEIVKRLQKSRNFQIIIRDKAYDVYGHLIGLGFVSVFVARDQEQKVWRILEPFRAACRAAEREGADPRYF